MYIDILDAGHGDSLLITCGETIILVDSGPQSFKVRKKLLQRIKSLLNGRAIDIAIVTHNDDDHIGGYKYLIDDGVIIRKFIFNSLDLIKKLFNKNKESKKISFKQDIDLQKTISDLGLNVQTLQYDDAPLTVNGITITALTPNKVILERLHKKAELHRVKNKISGSKTIEKSIHECLNDLKNIKDVFIEDNSITNKSSISFVLHFEKANVLFLGDSHPSDVISALKSKGFSNISFDAIKLAHHASEKNTSSELLELVGNTEYIICADKSHHGHPNNKTISRIIHFNHNAKFHMSSENEKLRTMFTECTMQGYRISVTYPVNGVNRVVL
ncbi:ComEC/Rec2 family competence protein [Aeromonas veronii]|uniref:ComEC/Rec2 family competence protein n=1 Tax=Aeromonas veronii TaxID=654 RepID=UPI001F46F772|nr:MBL fold metallo-hydrolase [Aeromonas veronii]MCF5888655.1 MBL fold metallo-hydrolase [Aeromonas veronii]